MNRLEIYQYLPLYAKLAIERLNTDSEKRTATMLNFLLDAYAKQYNESVDENIVRSAQHICSRRFSDFI